MKNGHFSISHVCYSKFFADNDFSKFTRPHLHEEKIQKKSPHASYVNVGNLAQNKQNELAFLRYVQFCENEGNIGANLCMQCRHLLHFLIPRNPGITV